MVFIVRRFLVGMEYGSHWQTSAEAVRQSAERVQTRKTDSSRVACLFNREHRTALRAEPVAWSRQAVGDQWGSAILRPAVTAPVTASGLPNVIVREASPVAAEAGRPRRRP
jgi:hypothetical protein